MKRPGFILFAGFLVLFVAGGSRFAVGLTLRAIVDDLGWGRSELGLAVALFQFVSAGAMFAAGYLVDRNGPNLFRQSVEQRLLCCNVRKVQALNRALAGLDAWVTGLRRDQWASRSDIRKVEIDHDHDAIVKLNPLAECTEEEVWDYLRDNEVQVHGLYAKGYTSIGCAPCTRPIAPGEPTRAGRWWWESDAPKECGMHCAIETGGFEHELHAILGDEAHE